MIAPDLHKFSPYKIFNPDDFHSQSVRPFVRDPLLETNPLLLFPLLYYPGGEFFMGPPAVCFSSDGLFVSLVTPQCPSRFEAGLPVFAFPCFPPI